MTLTGEMALGDFSAYYARPDGEGPFPVVLVVHEIFGVHEHIRDICRRFAGVGYLAIAPDLYARQGDVSGMTDNREINKRVVSKTPDGQVMSDLDAALDWATAAGKGDVARLAITGFCWGGRVAWLYAAHNANLKAAVVWYGKVAPPTTALQPRTPLDVARELKCPVLGLYGARDTSIPLDTVERMQEESGAEIIVYPDAGHAFFADYRPSYRPVEATDAWQRVLDFFKQHGV